MMTFEIARRLVKQGDSVEWFSASFAGAAADETLDGVHLVRGGRQWSVHWSAFRRYRGKLAQNFDVVVDEVNTIPFQTPLWADVPTVMFIHQLAREVWWYESKFPMNAVGFLAEPLYLRLYRNVPVLTVSSSTRHDLQRLGFRAPIVVLPQGLEALSTVAPARSPAPRFLYVGRLAPSKRVGDVIKAFAIFRHDVQSGELILVGDGKTAYVESLRKLIRRLGLSERVRFLGTISNQQKHEEMARAQLLLLASVREGWGLVVTEANSFGTPAVAYNVRGLRDSIQDGETGLLTDASPRSLADGMARAWVDHDLYERMSASARSWSRAFTFDETASAFRTGLRKAISDFRPKHGDLHPAINKGQ